MIQENQIMTLGCLDPTHFNSENEYHKGIITEIQDDFYGVIFTIPNYKSNQNVFIKIMCR